MIDVNERLAQLTEIRAELRELQDIFKGGQGYQVHDAALAKCLEQVVLVLEDVLTQECFTHCKNTLAMNGAG